MLLVERDAVARKPDSSESRQTVHAERVHTEPSRGGPSQLSRSLACVVDAAKSTEDIRGSIVTQLADCRAALEQLHDGRVRHVAGSTAIALATAPAVRQ